MRLCCLFALVLITGCSGESTSEPGDITQAGDTSVASDATGDDTTPGNDTPDAVEWTLETVPLRGACPMETRIGGFSVDVQSNDSVVSGEIADGVNPISVLEEVGAEGDCRLLRKEYPFCDPLCQSGTTCGQGGICVPFPENQNLGTISISGLEKEVVMEAVLPGNLYYDLNLPHPVYLPQRVIHLWSTAGWAGQLSLNGAGSLPLELTEPLWAIQEGVDLNFSWNAPDGDPRTQVSITLNIDQHGSSPVVVSCVFPDTGEASISSTLVDALMDYGISGYPNARVSRRTADSVVLDAGCVDFLVGSPRYPDIEVSGHYPCDSDFDCPPGLTCNIPIQSCQ